MALVSRNAVLQDSTNQCGAACCLFLLRIFGVPAAGENSSSVMRFVGTGNYLGHTGRESNGFEAFGSSPYRIGLYLEYRGIPKANIARTAGRAEHHKILLAPLRAATLRYGKHAGAFTANHAVLRMVTKPLIVRSHFVVETHFDLDGGNSQIMDPEQGMLYQDFDTFCTAEGYLKTGMDLVITG